MRLSFRDPDGYVFAAQDRILRCIHPSAARNFGIFFDSSFRRSLAENERIYPAALLPAEEFPDLHEGLPPGALLIEHRPAAFPNYPWEWSPRMLYAAAQATLELAEGALRNGFLLKDATPNNFIFEGAKPLFIDELSFSKPLRPETVWRACGQFISSFLYPLLAATRCGMRLDEIFTICREGLDTDRMWRMTPAWRLFLPPFLGLVTLPKLASSAAARPGGYQQRPSADRAEAEYVQLALLRKLRRSLERTRPAESKQNPAVRYMSQDCPYTREALEAKREFVQRCLREEPRGSVLDIGCNTGTFSLLAAECGARVVAIDHVPEAIDALWLQAARDGKAVLPLVVNIARPSPAVGWDNVEAPSFLHRAKGRFDCVMMLGLVHHLTVVERIPLERMFDLAAALTSDNLIIEFIDASDSQFRLLARGRDELFGDWTQDRFEACALRHFTIQRQLQVSPTRCIYSLARRSR